MSSDNYDAAMDAYAEERAAYDALNTGYLRSVARYATDDPRRFLAKNSTRPDALDWAGCSFLDLNEPGVRPGPRIVRNGTVPSWGELDVDLANAIDALPFADSEQDRYLDECLDADGCAMSCGEYRDLKAEHDRYEQAAERRARLVGRVHLVVWGCERNCTTPEADRRLRAACASAIAALAEWSRDPNFDPFAPWEDYATPDALARLADAAYNALRFAEALAREAGYDELADALGDIAAYAHAVAHVQHPPRATDEPAPRPPTPRTLAPPGRSIAAQPVCPNGPPTRHLSTGCSDAPLAA